MDKSNSLGGLPNLPADLIALIKAATREAVLAVKGPAQVKLLTGASDGQISRWQGDGYPDLIPSWAMMALEFKAQRPIFAAMFAGLTQNRCTPIGDDGGGGPGDFIADMVDFAQSSSAVTSGIAEAMADRRMSPAEAKSTIVKIGRQKVIEQRIERRLLAVVAGAGAGA